MNTTIAITKKTKDILQDFGKKFETYDAAIMGMYNTIKLHEKIREFVDESGCSTLKDAEEWTKLKIKAAK